MNLCLNARDAMPNGGQIVIETRDAEFDEEFCRHHSYAHPGCFAMLVVSDTGVGMDAATLDRIFEPFFTTRETGKGTGLGLATVYGVVKQHGGFVQVYSEPGHGTTFRIYFPASDTAIETSARKEMENAVPRGRETILIAEDHEGLREIARETIAQLGYQVVMAADGEEAVDKFRAQRDQIDLVLLDVVLPKLSGPEAYTRMQELQPHLPAIFTTGYSADTAMLKTVREKGFSILHKPYTPRSLARTVRETLDHKRRPSLT
jgi:CheY-like chemotaxis protein